jgi:hypothetical protein
MFRNDIVEVLQSLSWVLGVHAQINDIVEGIISLKQYLFVYKPAPEYIPSFCKEEGMYQGCPSHQKIQKLMLLKIAQIFMSYYYRPMLFKAQVISEADTSSSEQIINIAMKQFYFFVD